MFDWLLLGCNRNPAEQQGDHDQGNDDALNPAIRTWHGEGLANDDSLIKSARFVNCELFDEINFEWGGVR
jgi:hypothetical protein